MNVLRKAPGWFFGLWTLIFLGAGCAEEPSPPIDLVRMEALLSDIQEAEIYSSQLPDSTNQWTNKNKDSLRRYYQEIFAHHGVDAQEFEEALRWYAYRPHLLDTIYLRISRRYAPEGKEAPAPQE